MRLIDDYNVENKKGVTLNDVARMPGKPIPFQQYLSLPHVPAWDSDSTTGLEWCVAIVVQSGLNYSVTTTREDDPQYFVPSTMNVEHA